MSDSVSIQSLMQNSGVKFGTSGARGLAEAMTNRVCYAYTMAFLQHLKAIGEPVSCLAVAGDLRPSTARIMCAAALAGYDMGLNVIHCGRIPSPALALEGMRKSMPTVMVTGSHIPSDRNGIKYTRAIGEITKADEEGIRAQSVTVPDHVIDRGDSETPIFELPAVDTTARTRYHQRYVDFFGGDALQGYKLGLYQHSTVGRDLLEEILLALGAEVTPLARSETFVPVDTEAIRPEDVVLAKRWSDESSFDAILSADGDCDRPLCANEKGEWLRGDVLGVLCSAYLEATAVAAPVSCNTALEKSGLFKKVERTKIGSPFVIGGMQSLAAEAFTQVAGYEANGGFLQQTDVNKFGRILGGLPTRDALTPMVCALMAAKERQLTLSELCADLPARFTDSNRVENFATERSAALIAKYLSGGANGNEFDKQAFAQDFGDLSGKPVSADTTDGLRVTFENEEIIHLRPSGNAPELRCYTEAGSEERVRELNAGCMDILKGLT